MRKSVNLWKYLTLERERQPIRKLDGNDCETSVNSVVCCNECESNENNIKEGQDKRHEHRVCLQTGSCYSKRFILRHCRLALCRVRFWPVEAVYKTGFNSQFWSEVGP